LARAGVQSIRKGHRRGKAPNMRTKGAHQRGRGGLPVKFENLDTHSAFQGITNCRPMID